MKSSNSLKGYIIDEPEKGSKKETDIAALRRELMEMKDPQMVREYLTAAFAEMEADFYR